MPLHLPALLAALLLCAAGPAAAQAPASPAGGEAIYAQRCAECHRTPTRFMRRYLEMAPAERQARLEEFLRTHYAEDPAERATLVAWLEANHTRR